MEMVKAAVDCFSKEQRLQLIPFLVTFVLFFIQPYPQNSFLGAIFKILPNMSLIVFLVFNQSDFLRRRTTLRSWDLIPSKRHAFFMMAGLAFSVLGDLFMTNPEILIIPGGAVFLLSHLCYFTAIETDGDRSRTKSLFLLAFIAAFLSCQSGVDSFIEKMLILAYMAPLFAVGWKATAKFEENPGDIAAFLGCMGACLFILSDIVIIIFYFWGVPIPCAEFLFMVTYYGAQFGHATSSSDF